MELALSPENDRDITLEELAELAAEIEQAGTEAGNRIEVGVFSFEEFGPGLSWDEVLRLFLSDLPTFEVFRDAAVGIALDRTISWMRKRFRKHPNEAQRTRVIDVYNSEGELLRSYRIESEEAPPKIIEPPRGEDGGA